MAGLALVVRKWNVHCKEHGALASLLIGRCPQRSQLCGFEVRRFIRYLTFLWEGKINSTAS